MLVVGADGRRQIALGAMQACLDVAYADTIDFTWCGHDETGEAQGNSSADFQDDGSIAIAFTYPNDDEVVLTAVRVPSSAFC